MAELSMKEQLRKLLQLQQFDSKIFSLDKEMKELPVKEAALNERFQAKKERAAAIKKEIEELLLRRKDREVALGTKEEAIKKCQQQLYSLKTNKEYSLMLKEIEGIKADKSIIEDELLAVFDSIDRKKDVLLKEEDIVKVEEKRLEAERGQIRAKVDELKQQNETLQNKRRQAVQDVDPKILSEYERVLKNRSGLALVSVKNETCQGCFMNVTHQSINEIKMYEKVIHCEMCSRLLYIEEELES